MDIEFLANKARRSISDYCISECQALCCKKGRIIVSEKELKTMFKKSSEKFENNKDYMYLGVDGNIMFELNRKGVGCPSLKDEKFCLIHKSKNRSHTCHKFPIFIDEDKKTVHIHERCPAAFEGKLYPFISRAKKMGYIVIE